MSVKVASNRFTVSSLKRYAGFYQRILKGAASFKDLGNALVNIAEYEQAFRRYDNVDEAAQILVNLPLKEYQTIGQYYLGLCKYRKGIDPIETFEHVAETAPTRYRILAMHSLAAIGTRRGDHDFKLSWLVESLKIAPSIQSFRGLAIQKAIEGNHRAAVKDFEKYLPLSRLTEPLAYYDFLNSYAVELGEIGRKDEARNVSRIVLASPFAPAYPEWQETARDLKEPSRSFIVAPSIGPEHVEIEAIETHHASEPDQPATVLAFPTLKAAPKPQKPERLTLQEINELTTSEKRELILAALRTGTFTPFDYDRFMLMVGLLEPGPADKILDLEDEETVSDVAVVWANQVEPEQFAAVMSAIRDCEDRNRQRDIIDRMIKIAFQETQLCGLTEEAWRLRFERRLPKK